MLHKNVIYRTRHEVKVALIFSAIVSIIILFSGCMRGLQPSLDPMAPDWTDRGDTSSESCYCYRQPGTEDFATAPADAMFNIRFSTSKAGMLRE